MTIQNLSYLFRPTSVAVIGASNRPRSVGSVVMRNLLQGGFAGPIMPVNPKYESVQAVLSYRNVESLPRTPDLAVIATPPATVPGLIEVLGQRGTRAAIVLTAGLAQHRERDGKTLQQLMLDAARPYRLRTLGPNCLGLIVPNIGLNASFAHEPALPGRVAFVSQSGALGTAVLDWARSRGIGFSHFVSLGDMGDIDFGDVIDFLGGDPYTRAILLYIESIREARKFISAARGAARNKPLLVIKSGRVAEGAAAAASHTGALAGADDVYDAAFRRAGMLRVFETDELFDAVETLTRARPLRGDRLCILTNGGGPGVMATDALIAGGGRLAALADETRRQLDTVLPATWSRANPVDIIGDATPQRYAAAMRVLAKDANIDALLVMHVPTAVSSTTEVAQAVVTEAHTTGATILTTWLGGAAVEEARNLFAQAGLPSYETPDQAVRAFMHMVNYRRNQETLMETPASLPAEFTPDIGRARDVIEKVLADNRSVLTEPEAKAVLAAYDIPVVQTRIAATLDEAVAVAEELGFPVAVKVLSPDITHKTDVGGVALDLDTREAVAAAARRMLNRVRELRPEARIEGFSVQNMARRPRAHELIVGAATDSVFGPIMLFGQGGTAVEVIADRAVALPPLNMNLAKELISRTRVAKLLAGYRDRPPADLDAIRLTLIKVSQLIIDVPEVVELDINPLFADDKGVLALDARIGVRRAVAEEARLAIRPYPRDLEEVVTLRTGRQVFLRPIRPEDEPAHRAFISRLTPEDIRFRFFGLVREFAHSQLARFTQIDYDREMAFVATGEDEHGHTETLGVVRGIVDPDNQRAEFAIVVRSDIKGQGLGRLLLEKMIRYCRRRGNRELVGRVLADNRAMLDLTKRFGFTQQALPEGGVIEVSLKLAPEQAERGREKAVTPLRRPGPR